MSDASVEVKQEYKEESDPVGSWIKERYTISKKETIEDIVPCKTLLLDYSKYHDDNSLSNAGLKITTKFITKKVKELFNIVPFKHNYRDPISNNSTSGPAFYLKTKVNKEDEILSHLQTTDTTSPPGDIQPPLIWG